MQFLFETEAEVVDIYRGTVVAKDKDGVVTVKDYDIIAACDGAGSTARRTMSNVPGFKQGNAGPTLSFCCSIGRAVNSEPVAFWTIGVAY